MRRLHGFRLVGMALCAGLLALLHPAARLLLAVLAAVLAFLSLDDVAAFHERLNRFGEAWPGGEPQATASTDWICLHRR